MTGGTHDNDCLARMRAGDESALTELYDRYSGLVFPVAVRILGNPAEAEDVMQDVWLQVWRNTASYDERRGTLAAWLLTITRSRALDAIRSRAARSRREEQVKAEAPATVASANSAESSSSRENVRKAIERLDPHHRSVLELAYWQGLSQREIAERMQQPLGTVKSWTRQALRELRGALPEGEWW